MKAPDLISEQLHVVRGSDRRSRFAQAGFDMRLARLLQRVEHVPTLDFERFATKFIEARHAPHVGDNSEIFLQQIGAGDDFAENGS